MFDSVQGQPDRMYFSNSLRPEWQRLRKRYRNLVQMVSSTGRNSRGIRRVASRHVKERTKNTQPNIINNQGAIDQKDLQKIEPSSDKKPPDQTLVVLIGQLKKMKLQNQDQEENSQIQEDTIIKKMRLLAIDSDQSSSEGPRRAKGRKKPIKRRYKYWRRIKRKIKKNELDSQHQNQPSIISQRYEGSWVSYFQTARTQYMDSGNCFSDIYFQDQFSLD